MTSMTFAARPRAIAPALSPETFEKFRDLIQARTGIHMRNGKQILIANRLRKRLVALGLSTYEDYYDYLVGSRGETERHEFVDAISTNETYFYRENGHFRALAEVILPELFRSFGKLRIWSAGCSTGEEVYTLRIVADRAAKAAGVASPDIVGTDISTKVVEEAKEGIYRDRSLALVPPADLERSFRSLSSDRFQVRDEIRQSVEFRVHNLFDDPPPFRDVHLIFCRNVMIYFDKPTQARLIDTIFANAIHPNGYLCIGHSESLGGFSTRFAYVANLKLPIYRPRKETVR